MPFCINDGQLVFCDTPSTEGPIITTPLTMVFPVASASKTNIEQQQTNSYSSLDYHPQTLMLSGVATLLIIVGLLVCYCGYKKVSGMSRAPGPMPPMPRNNFPMDHIYAAPRPAGRNMPPM